MQNKLKKTNNNGMPNNPNPIQKIRPVVVAGAKLP